jgi:flagellar basal body rod protein FlgG
MPRGLTQVGDTSWRQSLLSGDALPGTPNSGTFGSIKSSALEQSNVDLTTELVDLITAQRNFQANSRSLEVNSSAAEHTADPLRRRVVGRGASAPLSFPSRLISSFHSVFVISWHSTCS